MILITSASVRIKIAAELYYAVCHVYHMQGLEMRFQDARGLLSDVLINPFYLFLKLLFHGTKRIRLWRVRVYGEDNSFAVLFVLEMP